MKNFLLTVEKWFAVVSLLLYSGGPLTLILTGGASEGDVKSAEATDISLILMLFTTNYIISLILLILRWKKAVYVGRQDWSISILISYAALSILWSETPSVTLRQIVALAGTYVFGIYIASRFNLKQQLQLLAQMFGLAIPLSFLFVFLLPNFGIMGGIHLGAWRGIYTHKNVLGKMMTLSTLVFGQLTISTSKIPWLLYCGMGLSVILLLLSKSTSSIISLAILLFAFLMLKFLRLSHGFIIPIFSFVAIFIFGTYVYLLNNLEKILDFFGKDLTFTGRTEIWQTALDMFKEKTFFGYGYGGFLENLDIQSRLASNIKLGVHNGFLEFTLDLGLIGLLLLLAWFVSVVFRSIMLLSLSKHYENYWPLIFILNLVLVNMSESTLMMRNNLFCVVSIALSFSVAQLINKNFRNVNTRENINSLPLKS
jgi:exopolysaccharide production protein ExoQ